MDATITIASHAFAASAWNSIRMSEYFIYQHRYNTVKTAKEQNCVDWTERLEKHLQLP